MRSVYHILLLSFWFLSAQAQTFEEKEADLVDLATIMTSFEGEAGSKRIANDEFLTSFVDLLQKDDTYAYGFDALKKSISIVSNINADIRIFSWQLMIDEDQYEYFGIIQQKAAPRKPIVLDDVSDELTISEVMELHRADWFGCYYYNMLPHLTPEGEQVYILFGYDSNDRFSKKKIIDVLHIDKDGQVVFGYPVFYHDDGPRYRRVFDVDATASTRVNFDADLDMIIYNHLIPGGLDKQIFGDGDEPTMKVYQQSEGEITVQEIKADASADQPSTDRVLFRPDGSYQGYRLIDGRWTFVDKVFNQVLDEAPRPNPVLGKAGGSKNPLENR